MNRNNLVSNDGIQGEDCLFCVSKHVAQAYILAVEALQGYIAHRWIAIGHLAEAERECINEFVGLSEKIRDLRVKMMGQTNDGWTLQDILDILLEARKYAEEKNGYSELSHMLKYYKGTENATSLINQTFPALPAGNFIDTDKNLDDLSLEDDEDEDDGYNYDYDEDEDEDNNNWPC